MYLLFIGKEDTRVGANASITPLPPFKHAAEGHTWSFTSPSERNTWITSGRDTELTPVKLVEILTSRRLRRLMFIYNKYALFLITRMINCRRAYSGSYAYARTHKHTFRYDT